MVGVAAEAMVVVRALAVRAVAKTAAAWTVLAQVAEVLKAVTTDVELTVVLTAAAPTVVKAAGAVGRAAMATTEAAVQAARMSETSTSDGVRIDSRCRMAAHKAQAQSRGTWRVLLRACAA